MRSAVYTPAANLPRQASLFVNRKTIASWCLFDFANSFYAVLPAVVWQTYYLRVIVGNSTGLGDLWWGRSISFSMLIVAITSPMMGGIADYAGIRKRMLMGYTFLCVTAVCLFPTVTPGAIVWGFVVTVMANVGFEGGIVFYNAFLPEIAPREYQGRVSGWGFAVGYAGSLFALLLAYPLIQAKHYNLSFISIAAAFLIFSIPAFLYLPRDAPPKLGVVQAGRAGVLEAWRTFREILHRKELRRFLIADFFFEDGVNTVIFFAASFASRTLNYSDTENISLFLVVQCSALLGAYVWAKPTDRLGPKRVVLLTVVQWIIVITACYFVQSKAMFMLIALLAGTGLGAVQSSARAFMSSLVPKGRETEFFAFYTLTGKLGAIMGPFIFGVVSNWSGGNQRVAILSVLTLFAIGGGLLTRVNAGGPTGQSQQPA